MDFYGFSNSIEQANAQANATSLANSAYNLYNAGAEEGWRQKKYHDMDPIIAADKKRGKDDASRVEREEIEQGGGTAVAGVGVYSVGKGALDTANKLGKAERIAEAQLKLARASGDAVQISKAQDLLDAAKSQKVSEFAKAASKLVGEKLLGAEGAKNVNKIVKIANDIQKSSTRFASASQLDLTKEGRAAKSIISQRAAELEDDDDEPKVNGEDVADDAGGKIADDSSRFQSRIREDVDTGPPNLEPEPEALPNENPAETADVSDTTIRTAGEESVSIGEDATKTMSQGGVKVAKGLFNLTKGQAPEGLDVLGAADRPDTFRSVRVAETQFGDAYRDPRDADLGQLSGFEEGVGEPDTLVVGEGTELQRAFGGEATTLMAQRRFAAVGEETSGFRQLFGGIRKALGGETDLTAGIENPLEDVDVGTDLGRSGAKLGITTGKLTQLGGATATGLDPTTVGLSLAESTETPASRASRALASLQGEVPPPPVDQTGAAAVARPQPQRAATPPPQQEAPQTDAETGQSQRRVLFDPEEEAPATEAAKPSGAVGKGDTAIEQQASPEAVELGTADHEAAVAENGGIDTRAIETGAARLSEVGGVTGAVGKAALKGVGALGVGLKYVGPAANAYFMVDQSYDEIKSLASGHGLSGDGTIGKIGGVLQEVGDVASFAGSIAAFGGPLGDVAALGLELGGGALGLVGDLLSDEGTKEKEQKEKQLQQQQLKADQKKQQATLSAENTAVEVAGAAGSANLAGRGSVAQVSQSAIRAF